uniref:RAB interacting factor n=1 Tax=Apteryx owenii TaxID=8824 RepID=A0A8B9PY31_APTOW
TLPASAPPLSSWMGCSAPGQGVMCVLPQLLLPAMRKKAAAAAGGGGGSGGDVVREHWLVRDMFSFENVGFTRDVGNVKFLVCADCEAGPIGWHCLDDKESFYVALERVAHE